MKNIYKSHLKYLGFNDLWMMIIGIPFVSFLIPMLFFGQLPIHGMKPFCSSWGVSVIFTTIFWIGNRYILIYSRKKYSLPEDDKKRIVRTYISIVIFTIGVNIIAGIIVPSKEGEMAYPGQGAFAGLFLTIFLVTIYEAVWASLKWRSARMEAERLKRENLQSQLSVLKSQVNPHFLFNSLNTLTSIIPEEPAKAVAFVTNLSRVYRCILEIKDQEVISLKEELKCIESYIYLLEARFGDNLEIELRISPEDYGHYIVPLSLQILLENAIKHNVVSSKKPLKVEIFSNDEGKVIVRNNLQLKDQEEDSTGTGLQNIDNRYQLVSEKRIEVSETNQSFFVAIPLLEISDYEGNHH